MRVVFMGTPDIAATCLKKILADGFDVVDRISETQVKDVFVDGVSAVIRQPVNDIYMQKETVETFGETYAKPDIKYWVK